MKYCPDCGSGVDAGDTYCYECGEDLSDRGAESSEAEETEEAPGEEMSAEKGGEESQEEDTEDLTDVEAIGETKAEALREAGYDTVDDLREATREELADKEGIGKAFAARIKSNVARTEEQEDKEEDKEENEGEAEEKDDSGMSGGEETDEKYPEGSRYPLLSVFASVMLLWAAFWSLSNSPNPFIDATLIGMAGVLIIPRVRNSVVVELNKAVGTDLTSQSGLWSLLKISVGALYTFLVAAMALLMIGDAANNPDMSPWAGVVSILIAFIVAVVAVTLSPPIESDGTVNNHSGKSD